MDGPAQAGAGADLMAPPWKAVLFDLDGTLIETAPEIADAVNDTLQHLGHDPVEQTRVDAWIGHGTRELLISALANSRSCAVQDSGAARICQIFRRFSRDITNADAAPAAASIPACAKR